jgi:hypothetical protein
MIKRLATYVWRHHLALLALFVVLGGTSYAAVNALPKNSVGSKQVINGSLQTLDLSRKARAALKGNRGPRGFTGAQGAQGAKGATGAQGARGPTGIQGPAAPKFLASIQATGTITRQQGGVTVNHTGTGAYTIGFPQDVSQCYPVANIFAVTGFIVMAGFSGSSMFVNTYNSANPPVLTDEPYYLSLFC